MKRPAGILVLGVLCIFTGIGNVLSPLRKPVILGGIIHTGKQAVGLHMSLSFLRIYIGYGLLKPVRHIWYAYIIGACLGIVALGLNVSHSAKIWELYLLLESRSEAIPRLVAFTIETHYLFMAIYALTAMYVYLQKPYFWGTTNV